ncbi:hypothetical protein GXW82_36985 [Streptacidiphilus sp. 4-A2]|nr:hypothetical protein [Streptacidiphilus sp. 4-A2]
MAGYSENADFGWGGAQVLTDGQNQISYQSSDGLSPLRRLMSNATEPSTVCDTQPAGSPNDLVTAFTRTGFSNDGCSGTPAVWTYGNTTGKATELIADASDPVWSDNGATLLFLRPVGSQNQVFQANANGTGAVQLTSEPNGAESPSLSPDGSTLAYSTFDNATEAQVVRTLVVGSSAAPVTVAEGSAPSWQPSQTNGLFDVYGAAAWAPTTPARAGTTATRAPAAGTSSRPTTRCCSTPRTPATRPPRWRWPPRSRHRC